MKIEEQVVSLELAKRLKELGVKQESVFLWSLDVVEGFRLVLREIQEPDDKSESCYAAFTVAELGEMLPDSLTKDGTVYLLTINRWCDTNMWQISYLGGEYNDGSMFHDIDVFEDTREADARAKMLVYLIEKGLVKP